MASQFTGTYAHNIDPKGRVTIPAQYREALGTDFTLGLNSQFTALALYPQSEWQKISARLDKIPASDARGMAYVRLINSFSYTDQQLDGQGRVLLPAVLRSRAGMTKEINFVGVGRFMEIWDAQRFMDHCLESVENFPEILDYVNERYFSNTDE